MTAKAGAGGDYPTTTGTTRVQSSKATTQPYKDSIRKFDPSDKSWKSGMSEGVPAMTLNNILNQGCPILRSDGRIVSIRTRALFNVGTVTSLP